jgi:hypothetical protein
MKSIGFFASAAETTEALERRISAILYAIAQRRMLVVEVCSVEISVLTPSF